MRRGLVAAALIVGSALGGLSAPAVLSTAPACAAAAGPHAGLVVVTSSGTSTFCVALDATEVSGLHLIELAHDQDGLSYSFGFGGQAVCQLDGVGPAGGDCFADYPNFWGYWHGDGSGGWTWASTGAGSARIGDGELDGWVWGTGDTPATHDAPPTLTIDDVCTPSPSPDPSSKPPASHHPSGGGGPAPRSTSVAPSPSAASSTNDPTASPSPHRDRHPSRSAHPTPTPSGSRSASTSSQSMVLAAGAVTTPPASGGPPIGLLLAGLLGAALVGGALLRRRSHTASNAGPGP
jgi:hypothetical protein